MSKVTVVEALTRVAESSAAVTARQGTLHERETALVAATLARDEAQRLLDERAAEAAVAVADLSSATADMEDCYAGLAAMNVPRTMVRDYVAMQVAILAQAGVAAADPSVAPVDRPRDVAPPADTPAFVPEPDVPDPEVTRPPVAAVVPEPTPVRIPVSPVAGPAPAEERATAPVVEAAREDTESLGGDVPVSPSASEVDVPVDVTEVVPSVPDVAAVVSPEVAPEPPESLPVEPAVATEAAPPDLFAAEPVRPAPEVARPVTPSRIRGIPGGAAQRPAPPPPRPEPVAAETKASVAVEAPVVPPLVEQEDTVFGHDPDWHLKRDVPDQEDDEPGLPLGAAPAPARVEATPPPVEEPRLATPRRPPVGRMTTRSKAAPSPPVPDFLAKQDDDAISDDYIPF